MRVNYRKLGNDFTQWAKSGSYDKPRTLRAELTSFNPVHRVNRGRNGVSELVELQTIVTEASGIHFETNPRSSLLEIYINSRVESEHGFGRKDRGVLIKVRDAKGKYHKLNVYPSHYETELNGLRALFGYEVGSAFDPEDFKRFRESNTDDVLTIAGTKPELTSNEVRDLQRKYTDTFYYAMASELERGDQQSLEKLCEFLNFRLVTVFKFVQRYWVSPQFVNVTSSSIEIGWKTNQTYNSLPVVLKVSKAREIRTVKLADLGIEDAGYYSHNDNMQVLPEQVDAAKRFASRFKNAKARAVKRVLESEVA